MDPLLRGRGLPRYHSRLGMLLFHFPTCISLGRSLGARNRVPDLDRLDENVNSASRTDVAGSILGDKVLL